MSSARTNLKDALSAAELLRRLGYIAEAEKVERLLRTNAGLRETCKRLWRDNVELRARTGDVE